MNQNIQPLFTILHFNDVYDIQTNKKGKGGCVNFEVYLRKLRQKNPNILTLFSGDAFSPSILSHVFQGKQMITALNKFNIDYACYGNHEFEFTPEITQNLAEECNFPWLLGNIKYKQRADICLGNGIPYEIADKFGLRIGIYGIAGQDWISILIDQYENELEYEDVGEYSKKMCKFLREEEKCDMIIALTHMRVPQDQQLPKSCPDIDIILGGHDHIVLKKCINQIPVIKSGDNFKQVGVINIYKKEQIQTQFNGRNFSFQINIEQVPIALPQQIDLVLQNHVNDCMAQYSKKDYILGHCNVELETRFSKVRTSETNYGNFIADLVRFYFGCDCCIINSGSIRNDIIIKPGHLPYSVVSNIINDNLVVKEVPGKDILKALQFSVSGLPDSFSGSFLLVSGLKYSYDYRKNPRIQQVEVSGCPLDLEKKYSIASVYYLSNGGDGYTMMKDHKFLVDQVAGIDTLSLLLKFFKGTDQACSSVKEGIKQPESLMTKSSFNTEGSQNNNENQIPQEIFKLSHKLSTRMNRIFNLKDSTIEGPNKQELVSISPKIDGRIKCLYP